MKEFNKFQPLLKSVLQCAYCMTYSWPLRIGHSDRAETQHHADRLSEITCTPSFQVKEINTIKYSQSRRITPNSVRYFTAAHLFAHPPSPRFSSVSFQSAQFGPVRAGARSMGGPREEEEYPDEVEERLVNEEYKIWKKNTPFLYGADAILSDLI